ncbi:MAG TPA: ABC transporter ATP-binding protein [Cytophagaceae bacterium]
MKTYFRILSFAKPLTRFVVPYSLFAFLAIVFGLLNFTFLMPVLDILFNNVNYERTTLPEPALDMKYLKSMFDYYSVILIQEYGKATTLIIICFFLVGSNLLANLFKYLSARTLSSVRSVVVKNIREKLFDKILSLHIGFFSNERKGDLMSRITSDVLEVENSVISTLTVFFRDPATVIIYFTVLFTLSWELTIYTLLILPTSGLIISMISKKLKRESVEGQQSLGNILSIIDETISGLRVMKGFNAERYIKEKFAKENHRYSTLVNTMGNRRESASPLSEFMGVSVVAVILWIGGNMVFTGELEPSAFFFFIVSFYQILVPVKAISSAATNIQRGLAAGERIFSILDTESPIREKKDAIQLDGFHHSIEYKNISFSYESELVLKDISFTIEKGKSVALVGPSGGGKSTLADLAPRFYDPLAGEILIDGKPMKDCSTQSIRALMGIVTQESILFNDSIFNNIAFGKPDASKEDVIRAAKIANAHDFILQTENGYDTIIGDRGMKLSGGQRQRISIARAVLKNPPILIMDEATSALDNESEKLVQEALSNLMKNRTSLVIAHRLSTIQHADEIIVIDKGRIVERGNHSELLQKNGLYKKLHSHSFDMEPEKAE